MQRVDELTERWNQLRNAALGRGLKPNVSEVLAILVQQQNDAYRAWLEEQGPLDSLGNRLPVFDEELQTFEKKFNAARTAVSVELPESSLPASVEVGSALERGAAEVAKTTGTAVKVLFGIGGLLAITELVKVFRGGRR